MERGHPHPSYGEDLAALAGELASPIVAVEPVSGRSGRWSYRLTLADGQVLKAKWLRDAAHAARVAQLLDVLDHPAFPAVSARRGAAILTRWVPGRPLRTDEPDLDLLRRCGALHALVHRRPAPDRAAPAGGQSALDRHARLRRDLDALVGAGRVEHAVATAAMTVAERHVPSSWTVGIVHGDFNAENLVRTETGEVAVVDNETVSLDAYAYDLARTWYRWPMTATQRAAYLDGYRRQASDAEFESHLPYWGVVVLVRGAAFRLRAGLDGVDEPLARLRASLPTWR